MNTHKTIYMCPILNNLFSYTNKSKNNDQCFFQICDKDESQQNNLMCHSLLYGLVVTDKSKKQ